MNEEVLNERTRVASAWVEIHKTHTKVFEIPHVQVLWRLRFTDFHRILGRFLESEKASLIFEAGCGSGKDSLYLASQGNRVVAVDIFFHRLKYLKNVFDSLRKRKIQSALYSVSADNFSLPFKDGVFDLSFNSGVLEHYSRKETRIAMLRELARVTRVSGLVAIVVPNKRHPFAKYWDKVIAKVDNPRTLGIPEQDLGFDDLHDEIRLAGLQSEHIQGIDAYSTISLYPSWLILRFISFLMRLFFPPLPMRLQNRWGVRILSIAKKI